MAVRTSSQAGNWSASATWGGNTPPGSTDTAVIGHAVTVDVNTTVGNNGGSTDAITLNAGSLTIADGVTLTVSGRLTVGSAAATINVGSGVGAGATLTFTNTAGLAGVVASVACTLNVTGKSGSRSTISYTGSGGEAVLTCGTGATNLYLRTSYANLTGLTRSGLGNCIGSDANGSSNINLTKFTSCEFIEFRATASTNYTMTNSTWASTVGGLCFINNCVAATSGTRTITGNCFDVVPDLAGYDAGGEVTGVTFDNNLCEGRVATNTGTFTSFTGNLLTGDPSGLADKALARLWGGGGTYLNNYLYSTQTGSNNPHFWSITPVTANVSMTFDGNVYQFGKTGTTGDLGDCVLANATDGTHTLTVNCIRELVIPSDGGVTSGQGFTIARAARGITVGAQHCTYCVTSGTLPLPDATARAGADAEHGDTTAYLGTGMIPYFRSNICWTGTASGGYKAVLIPEATDGGITESWNATGGDATHLNDTGRAWVVNIFTAGTGAGTYKVRLLTGANAGSIGTITANTATQLTVSSWSAGAPANGDGYKIFIVDAMTPTGVGYNCGYNTAVGEAYDSSGVKIGSGQGNGYHQTNSSTNAALGATDISANPTFVDSTRNIQTWDALLGGPGTGANALAQLRKRNDDTGYNSAYTIAALVTWVKAGFAPTNLALAKASHDGIYIGAIPIAASAGIGMGAKLSRADDEADVPLSSSPTVLLLAALSAKKMSRRSFLKALSISWRRL